MEDLRISRGKKPSVSVGVDGKVVDDLSVVVEVNAPEQFDIDDSELLQQIEIVNDVNASKEK